MGLPTLVYYWLQLELYTWLLLWSFAVSVSPGHENFYPENYLKILVSKVFEILKNLDFWIFLIHLSTYDEYLLVIVQQPKQIICLCGTYIQMKRYRNE
jgi:hypothetical protein